MVGARPDGHLADMSAAPSVPAPPAWRRASEPSRPAMRPNHREKTRAALRHGARGSRLWPDRHARRPTFAVADAGIRGLAPARGDQRRGGRMAAAVRAVAPLS